MNKIFRTVSFFVMLIFGISNSANAQIEGFLDQFTGFQDGETIRLSWTIGSGNICNGTLIDRAPDTVSYEKIGEIAGICGNISSEESYEYIDENPFVNGHNYYRLRFGGVGNSNILDIEFLDLQGQGYTLIRDFNSGETGIYFYNPNGQEHRFRVFTVDGKLIQEETGTDNYFIVNNKHRITGVAVFEISDGSKVSITGKLIP